MKRVVGARPAVSVILPTRDRASSLPRSIYSVLSQSFEDLELVVVDDASSDATADVVAGFGDARVRYIRLECSRGAAAARNAGLAISTADLVSFQDSDDEWLPNRLAVHVERIQAAPHGVEGVYSDGFLVREDDSCRLLRAPEVVRGRLVDPETRFYQSFMLGTPAATVVRAAIASVGGFDERLPAFEDLDLFLRLSARYELVRVGLPLTKYYAGSGLSSRFGLELAARRKLLVKHHRALLKESPAFVASEALALALRRGLHGIVEQHLSPLDAAAVS